VQGAGIDIPYYFKQDNQRLVAAGNLRPEADAWYLNPMMDS